MFDLNHRTYGANSHACGIGIAISERLADLPDSKGKPVAERLSATVTLFTFGASKPDGMCKNVGAFWGPVNGGYH